MLVTEMDKRVEYLIEYCGYSDFEGLLSKNIPSAALRKLMLPLFESVSRLFYKIDFKDFDAGKALSRIKKPVMIIHSKADKTVNFYNCSKLMKYKPDAKVHIFEDTMHARSMVKYPEVFKQIITDFVKEAESKVGLE